MAETAVHESEDERIRRLELLASTIGTAMRDLDSKVDAAKHTPNDAVHMVQLNGNLFAFSTLHAAQMLMTDYLESELQTEQNPITAIVFRSAILKIQELDERCNATTPIIDHGTFGVVIIYGNDVPRHSVAPGGATLAIKERNLAFREARAAATVDELHPTLN